MDDRRRRVDPARAEGSPTWLRNTNDVIIELRASEKSGLAITGGANGVLVQFED